MAKILTVAPARPELKIPMPERAYALMPGPVPVDVEDPYWMRLLADGDVVCVSSDDTEAPARAPKKETPK